ncbi:hypothetical protein GCM10023093_00630 [Nemorincola caseinilytica]|uniref:histidine kinase n=1 Tax=Nemorincola caseinilytica TaxID=2054315 RepID=A0ABP8N588_9BACT
MRSLSDLFRQLFDSSDWPQGWQNGNWTDLEGWMHIAGDGLIWLVCTAMAVAMARIAFRRGNVAFLRVFYTLAIFMALCGITHLSGVLMFWVPVYRVDTVLRAIVALAGIYTLYRLLRNMRAFRAMRTEAEQEREVTRRREAEEKVRILQAELDRNLQEKKAEAERILQDVTALRNAEAKLRTRNMELEQQAAEHGRKLEAMNRELEVFSYSVSHDMRAPLRIIGGYTDMLYTDHKEVFNEESKRLMDAVIANTRHMSEMIDALLNLSRLSQKDLMILPADMDGMVRSAVAGLPAGNDTVNFVIGDMIPVACDSVLMRQVWHHLVANAIKFSARQPQPVIKIGSEQRGDKVLYYVRDNGVGFDMKYAHKLFGMFQRLHKKTDMDGQGTGLAIVQRIVLKHGGYVWAESEENKGATFYFTLPIKNTDHDGNRTN